MAVLGKTVIKLINMTMVFQIHFYGKVGDFQKDCPKCKAQFEKKGEFNAYVCLELNLTKA